MEENEVKTFTQEELNKVVQERVAREQAKYADYEDIKGIKEELQAFGYEGTTAEIRQAIKQQREEVAKQQELQELQQQAQNEGTSPELLKEIRELKKEISDIKGERQALKQAEEEKQKQTETEKAQATAYEAQRAELLEKHGIDANQLAENKKFMNFVKGKTGINLVEQYEDFIELVGESEADAIKKVMSKQERSTFSGKDSANNGGGYGLTPSQMQIAKENGMTSKEYAEGLKLIRR